MQPFVSRDAHFLWKLMTKEDKLEQRNEMHHGGGVEVGHGQRGSNIEEYEGIKILGQ